MSQITTLSLFFFLSFSFSLLFALFILSFSFSYSLSNSLSFSLFLFHHTWDSFVLVMIQSNTQLQSTYIENESDVQRAT